MKNNLLYIALAILMAAVGIEGAAIAKLSSEADAAEAHAAAADDRAGSCEAKFSYSTVIVEPQLSGNQVGNPGVNLYHGMFRLSLNQAGGAPTYTAQPRFVIPAQVTPQSAGTDTAVLGDGPVFYWVNNKTHDQRGPYKISAGVLAR
jgi:hypothetical protein